MAGLAAVIGLLGSAVAGLALSDAPTGPSLIERLKGRPMMPGWRPVTLSGQTVYAVGPEDRSFAWSAGGFVYTLVADAPMQTVSQVVAALPGTTRLGFWPRIARGLRRLASWINPVR
jgi:hypothetical protein